MKESYHCNLHVKQEEKRLLEWPCSNTTQRCMSRGMFDKYGGNSSAQGLIVLFFIPVEDDDKSAGSIVRAQISKSISASSQKVIENLPGEETSSQHTTQETHSQSRTSSVLPELPASDLKRTAHPANTGWEVQPPWPPPLRISDSHFSYMSAACTKYIIRNNAVC